MYYVETSTGRKSFVCIEQAARKALQHNTTVSFGHGHKGIDPCIVLRLAPGY